MANNTKNYEKQGGAEWVVGGNLRILSGGNVIQSVGAPAAAGSTIADATAMTADKNYVTAADGTKGVKLPALVVGESCKVTNTANAILKVYPAADTIAINALSAGAAISMAAYSSATFDCATATQLYTTPYLPS